MVQSAKLLTYSKLTIVHSSFWDRFLGNIHIQRTLYDTHMKRVQSAACKTRAHNHTKVAASACIYQTRSHTLYRSRVERERASSCVLTSPLKASPSNPMMCAARVTELSGVVTLSRGLSKGRERNTTVIES